MIWLLLVFACVGFGVVVSRFVLPFLFGLDLVCSLSCLFGGIGTDWFGFGFTCVLLGCGFVGLVSLLLCFQFCVLHFEFDLCGWIDCMGSGVVVLVCVFSAVCLCCWICTVGFWVWFDLLLLWVVILLFYFSWFVGLGLTLLVCVWVMLGVWVVL